MIPDSFLEELQFRLDAAEVIGEYVRLQQAGRSLKGLCPFHSEKTPSFTVNKETGLWYCFGCQEGGNLFQFLMKVENFTFSETVSHLAARVGLEVPARQRRGGDSDTEREKILEILELATRFYHWILTETPAGRKGMRYLDERGMGGEAIKEFRLGLAPGGSARSPLAQFLIKKGYEEEILLKSGVVARSKRGKGIYDYFQSRLLFPVANLHGKITAFGGRSLDGSPPKYLNSPETSVFRKRETLFPFFHARGEIKAKNQAVLVEGYMDALMAHQAHIKNTVATLGTSLSLSHAKFLRRYCGEVVVAYDADRAGREATTRTLSLFQEAEIWGRVAMLPEGEDPDTFIKKHGGEAFLRLVAQSPSLLDYQIEEAKRKNDTSTPNGKKKFIEVLLPVLKSIRDPVSLEHYVRVVAQQIGLREETLRMLLLGLASDRHAQGRLPQREPPGAQRSSHGSPSRPDRSPPSPSWKESPLEREVIRLLLTSPEEWRGVWEEIEPEDFHSPTYRKIALLLHSFWKEDPSLLPHEILRRGLAEGGASDSLADGQPQEPPAQQETYSIMARLLTEETPHRIAADSRAPDDLLSEDPHDEESGLSAARGGEAHPLILEMKKRRTRQRLDHLLREITREIKEGKMSPDDERFRECKALITLLKGGESAGPKG